MHNVASSKWQVTTLAVCYLLLGLLASCSQPVSPIQEASTPTPNTLTLIADGQQQTLSSQATTVRELLDEANITLNPSDEVTPPLFTPLSDNLTITIVRVSESVEIVPQSIPFSRKIVRNETMAADDPPRIIQPGQAGLQEQTIRIVFRDGLEAERFVTQVTIVEPTQDEIVMVGIGGGTGNINFTGTLAYINGGQALLLRGSTAFAESLNTGGNLDGRVFRLSPSGSHLLYTRVLSSTTRFGNSLWVVGTEQDAQPRPLEVSNVLWADWDPSSDQLDIAYSTAIPTDLPPGWEANNDLWLGTILSNSFEPRQLVESYPATYGWWGGNYAWSPQGQLIGYSFANEVGVIDTNPATTADRRRVLQRFTEYNTLSDWVWVPTLSWSANGRYLTFTTHGSTTPEELVFDSWIVDVRSETAVKLLNQSGMWANLYWTSVLTPTLPNSQLAYLQATDPLNSQRSNYTLWLMDSDGSNGRQLYPPVGENSRFPREQQSLAWGPTGQELAFIFNDNLLIMNLETGEAVPATQDDAISSHPTWAPYGIALTNPKPTPPPTPSPTPSPLQQLLPADP